MLHVSRIVPSIGPGPGLGWSVEGETSGGRGRAHRGRVVALPGAGGGQGGGGHGGDAHGVPPVGGVAAGAGHLQHGGGDTGHWSPACTWGLV